MLKGGDRERVDDELRYIFGVYTLRVVQRLRVSAAD